MTNARSRKVLTGNVTPLMIYIGSVHPTDLPKTEGIKPLGVWQLYLELGDGLEKWVESFNTGRTKFEVFFSRSDYVISDARYQWFEVTPEFLKSIAKDGR